MGINYNPSKWENGKTVIKASHFEKIEKGITDIINYNNSIYTDEDKRKENEIKREEEHNKKLEEIDTLVDDLKSDYDALEKIIIDENASANLQKQINSVNSQLAHKPNKNELPYIDVRDFGAKGDGVTDDTMSIQNAFDYVSQNGGEIRFSKKRGETTIYKVTQPIRVEWKQNPDEGKLSRPRVNKISFDDGVWLKGFSIPENRAVLELWGQNNGWAASVDIDNMKINMDRTCSNKSFCLLLGDSFGSTIERMTLEGYNGLILKCGDSGSYAMIRTVFRDCTFSLQRYLYSSDYHYTDAIASDIEYWAVVHEYIINGRTNSFSPWDNIKFDNCLFCGLVNVDAYMANFDNCMWSVDPRRRKINNILPKYADKIVDFGACLLVTNATMVKLNQCYFEDHNYIMDIYPRNNTEKVLLQECYFNGLTNYETDNGTSIKSKRILNIEGSVEGSRNINSVIMENCHFRDGYLETTQYFEDDLIKNDSCKHLMIKNCVVDKGYSSVESSNYDIKDLFRVTGIQPYVLDFTVANQYYYRPYTRVSYNKIITFKKDDQWSNYSNTFKYNDFLECFVADRPTTVVGYKIYLSKDCGDNFYMNNNSGTLSVNANSMKKIVLPDNKGVVYTKFYDNTSEVQLKENDIFTVDINIGANSVIFEGVKAIIEVLCSN